MSIYTDYTVDSPALPTKRDLERHRQYAETHGIRSSQLKQGDTVVTYYHCPVCKAVYQWDAMYARNCCAGVCVDGSKTHANRFDWQKQIIREMAEKGLYPVAETSRKTGASIDWIYRRIDTGQIRCERLHRIKFVDPKEVKKLRSGKRKKTLTRNEAFQMRMQFAIFAP